MAAHPQNLINLNNVSKAYGAHNVLSGISLGIERGARIGIVGRNGDGKSTLLKIMAGTEESDGGEVTRTSGLDLKLVAQGDDLNPRATIRDELVGGMADHEWAGDATIRSVLDGLLGGVNFDRFETGIDTPIEPLSGGERRRIALAQALIQNPELLLLDEPTNHLDIDGVAWLARHLAQRRGSLAVITHDRWFLDEVCLNTWEVVNQHVNQYDGGYSAYVLARAERDRLESVLSAKRRQLVKKELAWLRRGPPARTSKPKFRIEAANQLIADEPEPRNSIELMHFASSRLGDRVLDAVGVGVNFGERLVLSEVTWRIGPGQRIGLVGANGSGKTTLIRVLAGELKPGTGTVKRGTTVKLAHLTQDVKKISGNQRVLEALSDVRQTARIAGGGTLSASQLCERFGFGGSRAGAMVGDLSGGEQRRLQLMRLMMEEPNVLILDEPTNDLDIDTLTSLEDLLDTWPGTIIVVSHDRYFIERVCDDVYRLMPDGQIRHLPGGIEQYINELGSPAPTNTDAGNNRSKPASRVSGGDMRKAKKEFARVERRIEKLLEQQRAIEDSMTDSASNHARLMDLNSELEQLKAEQTRLEELWLELIEILDS